jgi:hypothetical protein
MNIYVKIVLESQVSVMNTLSEKNVQRTGNKRDVGAEGES